jgi:hypothetical protein
VYEYDIFLSSPMSAFSSDSEYKKERSNILKIIDTMMSVWNVKKVYYAGESFSSNTKFDASILSLKYCIDALDKSKCFVMIYPQQLVSSVLVEAGYAIAKKMKSIYFVKNKNDLPYILRDSLVEQHSPIVWEYKSLADIKKLIFDHRF